MLQLKADVQFFTRNTADGAAVDIVGLACDLANLGYEIKVRYAEGGGANCFKNLCHEFILVKVRCITSQWHSSTQGQVLPAYSKIHVPPPYQCTSFPD